MDPIVTEARDTEPPNRRLMAGAVVLLAINAFLSWRGTRPAGRGVPYWIGAVFGAAFVFAVVGLLVYGVARAFGRARSGAAKARFAFWTMAVLLLANLANLAVRAVR